MLQYARNHQVLQAENEIVTETENILTSVEWSREYVEWLVSQPILVRQGSLLKHYLKIETTQRTVTNKVTEIIKKSQYIQTLKNKILWTMFCNCRSESYKKYLFQVNLEWFYKVLKHFWGQTFHYLFNFLQIFCKKGQSAMI